MNRYLCKCGRAVNKSTNADNTGNRETEGCEGCPYLMPWGPTEWDHTRHAMVTDVKGYECRMSPTLEYTNKYGDKRQSNEITRFLPPEEPKAAQGQGWTQGSF